MMTSRRHFIYLLGGAAAAWPVAGRGQQGERVRRIGLLMPLSAENAAERAHIDIFLRALESLGWSVGRNLEISIRWGAGDADLVREHVAELVAAQPDVILTSTNQGVASLRRASRTVPIVFVMAIDPVGAGDIASLARPGGNATGFLVFEYSISGKWLELLKTVTPNVARVAVLRDPEAPAGIGQFAAIQAVAPPFRVELSTINIRDPNEIELGIASLAREPNTGLIMTASAAGAQHRQLIVRLATQYRLPVVSPFRNATVAGTRISYGPDLEDQYNSGAGYVDRILKGEKPSDLPVQAPTRYELVINLKTAKALGLEVPPMLLARANEVIE